MVKTIVWIDDDTEIIDAVVYPLERVGHRIIRLHTEPEALAAIDQLRHADLLLLAMIFPPSRALTHPHRVQGLDRYTGLHLLQLLRDVYHLTTPVVALTAVICPDLDRALQALDVADILHKPVRPSELKQRIEAVWATYDRPDDRLSADHG